MIVCQKNQYFFPKCFSFNSFVCKISGKSNGNFHRLLQTPDLCVSTYCDEKTNNWKQLLADINKNEEEEEKKDSNDEGKALEASSSYEKIEPLGTYNFLKVEKDIASGKVFHNSEKIKLLDLLRKNEFSEAKEVILSKKVLHSNRNADGFKQVAAGENPREEVDISKIKILKSVLSELSMTGEFSEAKEDVTEKGDVSQSKNENLHVGDITKTKSVLVNTSNLSTVQSLPKNNSGKEIISNLLNEVTVEKKIVNKDNKKEKFPSGVITLKDAVRFTVANSEIISLDHVLYIIVLLGKHTFKEWANTEQKEFFGSQEFLNLQIIFLKFIPKIPNNFLIYQFLPLFSKNSNLPLEDIVFYEILKKIDSEFINLKLHEKIRCISLINHKSLVCNMVYDLKKKFEEELILLNYNDYYSLSWRDLLRLSFKKSVPENVKIMALEKFLAVSFQHQEIEYFADSIQIFYLLSDDSRKKYAHLEKKILQNVKTFFLNDQKHCKFLCIFIHWYGQGVILKKAELDRKFVDDILNAIFKFKSENLSANIVEPLLHALISMRHINHGLIEFVEEFFIKNFDTVIRDHGLLLKIIQTLSNYDVQSRRKEWPFLKILLENLNLHTIMYSGKFTTTNALNYLLTYTIYLTTMGVYPEKVLNKISLLSGNKKTIMAPNFTYFGTLLSLHHRVYYLHSERRCLLSEEIINQLLERIKEYQRDNFYYQDNFKKRERLKLCLEGATGVEDSVLINCYSKQKLRAPLIMVFNNENKPYCLRDFLENEKYIEDFNFPAESKKVVIKIKLSSGYFQDSYGNCYFSARENQNHEMFEKLGFIVVVIESEILDRLADEMLGPYVYDRIKKSVASSSV